MSTEANALFKVGERRRFECTTSGSNKFWEVELKQSNSTNPMVDGFYTVAVKYGKLGTAGSTELKSFQDIGTARRYIFSKIDEKMLKKSYTFVGSSLINAQMTDPIVATPVPEKLIAQGEWDIL